MDKTFDSVFKKIMKEQDVDPEYTALDSISGDGDASIADDAPINDEQDDTSSDSMVYVVVGETVKEDEPEHFVLGSFTDEEDANQVKVDSESKYDIIYVSELNLNTAEIKDFEDIFDFLKKN